MTVLGAAAGTLGWLACGEAARRGLERATGAARGPVTVLLWPAALLAEGALYGGLWLLGRRSDAGLPAAPLGWQVMRDDGGWQHPEEAMRLARAECEAMGHVPARSGVCHRCSDDVG